MGRAYEVRKASMEKTGKAKAKLYSMYAKEILQAAKNGTDPISNDQLKRLIEKAKKDQVPADIINRNIDKVKKGATEDYSTIEYELFGPSGSTLIVKCLTDNTNRTISEVKTICNKTGAKMVGMNSVAYNYEYLCVVGVKDKTEEEIMDILFSNDIEVTDIENDNGLLLIYSEVQNLFKIKKTLEEAYKDIKFEVDEIGKYAKDMIKLQGEDLEQFNKLINMLEDLDDVSNIYHNVELN
jgi:YebC/PmpR family DNA-binding regulatory protein